MAKDKGSAFSRADFVKYILLGLALWVAFSFLVTSLDDEEADPISEAKLLVREGNELLDAGEYDAAIEAFDEAIRQDPGLADAYWSRGVAYFEKGDYRRAVENYSEVIALEPEGDVLIYLLRADAYARMGRTQEAIADYERIRDAEGVDEELKELAEESIQDLQSR